MSEENGRPPKKLYMSHNSCMNASYDFNVLKEGMRRKGYVLTDKPEEADEIIFSGCGAHRTWVDDAIGQINALTDRAPSAKVTVTGCVAGIDAQRVKSSVNSAEVDFGRQEDILKSYAGLDFSTLDRELAQDTGVDFEGSDNAVSQIRKRVGDEKMAVVHELEMLDREYGTSLEKLYRNTTKGFVFYNEADPVGFITVTRSCPYKCSFCAIPRGRGAYSSVPLADIVEKASQYLKRGIKRLTLIGDEVGNYGADTKTVNFADLIEALLGLDPQLKLSIRYVEPKPFWKNRELFTKYCGAGRFEMLYVPLQSGSQRILDKMRRNYKLDKILGFYRDMRSSSDTVFYCNWMVGFPGETAEDFGETAALVQDLNLQINTAIPFSPRPDTPALTMDEQISDADKKARLLTLRSIIADMKAAEFCNRLPALPDSRRISLGRLIGEAEMVHVDDFAQQGTGATA